MSTTATDDSLLTDLETLIERSGRTHWDLSEALGRREHYLYRKLEGNRPVHRMDLYALRWVIHDEAGGNENA